MLSGSSTLVKAHLFRARVRVRVRVRVGVRVRVTGIDAHVGGGGHRGGLLGAVEVAWVAGGVTREQGRGRGVTRYRGRTLGHGRHMGLRVGRPRAHLVRVLGGVGLH